MFIDARSIPQGSIIEADICVIGGGAAGITVGREFIGTGFRVCLLESGGLRMQRQTQQLYEGESVGLPYELDTTRSRYFGKPAAPSSMAVEAQAAWAGPPRAGRPSVVRS